MASLERNQAFVLWLTGLSGSGKSTLSDRIYDYLLSKERDVERLDGDMVRDIFPATGFTRPERDEHIRRIAFVASLLEKHGVIVIASFVSPYRQARDFARRMCGNFIEVYVSASLQECASRDVKGLYRKAQQGLIENFTGIDDPYEPPENPEIVVDTENQTVDQSVAVIASYIKRYL